MYILELEATVTEIKIIKDHNITLLTRYFSIPILFEFPEYLKLFAKCLF